MIGHEAAAGPARTKPPQRSTPNFTYSSAMQNAHKVWDEAQLDVYITDPRHQDDLSRPQERNRPQEPDRLSRHPEIIVPHDAREGLGGIRAGAARMRWHRDVR
jgi:hypothetical protein